MRRDVSEEQVIDDPENASSLHAQRCFRDPHFIANRDGVFSACAEMFLGYQTHPYQLKRSSLHAQRCFRS